MMAEESKESRFDPSKLFERRDKDPKAVAKAHKIDLGQLTEEEAPLYEPTPEEIENAKRLIAENEKKNK